MDTDTPPSLFGSLLDAERSIAVTTTVRLGMFHDLGTLVARELPTIVLTDHPPVRRFEPLAVL